MVVENKVFQQQPEQPSGRGVMCSALIVAAPHSGSGKTTITAALARYHRNQGKKVTVFKVGPDFIDPMILRQASGELVYQLDLWLIGEEDCQALLYKAALDSDLILIEGVMGLFDGTPSSADLAQYFNIPVLGVIDAKAMAQTFAAVTFGLAKFRSELPFAGVIANRVNSERHADLLKNSLPEDFCFHGRMPKDENITLPERHLGLVQAQELTDIDSQLDQAASHIANTSLIELPEQIEFFNIDNDKQKNFIHRALVDTKIIIIRDNAFSFLYAANIAFLEEAGAKIIYCSALTDAHLPEGDILYIPGGYPELYAKKLLKNISFIKGIKEFAALNKPIVAECGGMLYLLDQLTDMSGNEFAMLGLLPGKAIMHKNLASIGSQWVDLSPLEILAANTNDKENISASEKSNSENIMRGHSFHYSRAEINVTPICQTIHHPSDRLGEHVYQYKNILASYMHWYLPSNPGLALRMFNKARCVITTEC